jgi:hypothetical protein
MMSDDALPRCDGKKSSGHSRGISFRHLLDCDGYFE